MDELAAWEEIVRELKAIRRERKAITFAWSEIRRERQQIRAEWEGLLLPEADPTPVQPSITVH